MIKSEWITSSENNIYFWTKFHGEPFNICWHISRKTTNVMMELEEKLRDHKSQQDISPGSGEDADVEMFYNISDTGDTRGKVRKPS